MVLTPGCQGPNLKRCSACRQYGISNARQRKTAIWARVTLVPGQ